MNSILTKVSAYILNPLIFILFSVAFIYFAWGVIQLINADANKKSEAKDAVVWGLVGMFIMFSTYGIIRLILDTFGINKSEVPFITNRL
jgi:TRAP-type C4-dicarboxylate transport system permease small subunit